jgi:hypothetical protein
MPDVEAFLALAPEELAAKMLFLLQQRKQDMITGSSLENELWGGFGGAPGPAYPTTRQHEVHLAFAEAWGTNFTQLAKSGWRRSTRLPQHFLERCSACY